MTPEPFAIVPKSVGYDLRLTPLDVRVYFVLAMHADYETGECWLAAEHIAELIGVSRRVIAGSTDRLRKAGHIEVERRGRTLTNLYRVMGSRVPITDEVMGTNRQGDGKQSSQSDGKQSSHKRQPKERQPSNERKPSRANVNPNGEYPGAFERFWAAYPRHVGKAAALKAWRRATHDRDPDAITAAAAAHADAWQDAGTDRRYIPHPATWLNGARYDDEELPGQSPGDGPSVADRIAAVRNGRRRPLRAIEGRAR